jgi:hypothetical protein
MGSPSRFRSRGGGAAGAGDGGAAGGESGARGEGGAEGKGDADAEGAGGAGSWPLALSHSTHMNSSGRVQAPLAA